MSDLGFDWEAVVQRPVTAVVGRNERRMNDGSLAWDAIAFAVGNGATVLTVTDDTDEIVVAHEVAPDDDGWVTVAALGDTVGKPLGWCWLGTNYRGYRDSFTLALGRCCAPRAPASTDFSGRRLVPLVLRPYTSQRVKFNGSLGDGVDAPYGIYVPRWWC